MFKKIAILSFIVFAFSISSCKKKCVYCHKIKMYDNAKPGVFDIISKQEACGALEKRTYRKDKNSGTDTKGSYKTWWECDLYPDDTTAVF